MKKIITSLSIIAAVAAVVIGGTTAYFSDTEKSAGNTFTAGAIDLKVDDHCWYNGKQCTRVPDTQRYTYGGGANDEPCVCTWDSTDLTEGNLFFSFKDIKPGDWGEDTISLHVYNNDAWACADIEMIGNDDADCSEPEKQADACEINADLYDGELAQNLEFMWWADDGDNVLETDEQVSGQFVNGTLSFLLNEEEYPYFGPPDDNAMLLTLSDSDRNFFNAANPGTPMNGEEEYYIGKAWCFGTMTIDPVTPSENNSPASNPGFICDGSLVGNESQTDLVEADISFTATQSRNNGKFLCPENITPPTNP